jgi:hypothetical protein
MFDPLPIVLKTRSSHGKAIEFVGGDKYSAFWRINKDILAYDAVIESDIDQPLFTIKRTKVPVGGVTAFKNGGVILLLPAPSIPEIESEGSDEEEGSEYDHKRAFDFLKSIEALAAVVSQKGDQSPPPEWVSRFALPGEAEAHKAVVMREAAVEKARNSLDGAKRDLVRIQAYKDLITAQGRQLEVAVKEFFEELGGQVQDPDPGRDDWIVQFPEGTAVAEVKGKQSSAAEADAAQLEKWVASYLETTGKSVKGILVVNGWRDVPLDKRTKDVFPHQMLKYSEARGHCLMTGLQALNIRLAVASGKIHSTTVRKLLLESSGILAGYDVWSEAFERIEVQVHETDPKT